MTDRKKLIELLIACDKEFDVLSCYNERPRKVTAAAIVADYLLTNSVVVQKHGRWEDKATGAYRRTQSWCTACGIHSGIGGIESNRHKPYCPNCGAKMNEEGTQ